MSDTEQSSEDSVDSGEELEVVRCEASVVPYAHEPLPQPGTVRRERLPIPGYPERQGNDW